VVSPGQQFPAHQDRWILTALEGLRGEFEGPFEAVTNHGEVERRGCGRRTRLFQAFAQWGRGEFRVEKGWRHYACVYDAADRSRRIYVNGQTRSPGSLQWDWGVGSPALAFDGFDDAATVPHEAGLGEAIVNYGLRIVRL
jgi:hypothetical protein